MQRETETEREKKVGEKHGNVRWRERDEDKVGERESRVRVQVL